MSRNSIQQLFARKRGGDENFASGHGGGFLGLLFEGGLGDEGFFLRLTRSLTDGGGHGGEKLWWFRLVLSGKWCVCGGFTG